MVFRMVLVWLGVSLCAILFIEKIKNISAMIKFNAL
jgi:hypothetical protein